MDPKLIQLGFQEVRIGRGPVLTKCEPVENIHHHQVWAWKNKKMAGVDHFLVYMQTAVKYWSLYKHHPGALRAPVVVYI